MTYLLVQLVIIKHTALIVLRVGDLVQIVLDEHVAVLAAVLDGEAAVVGHVEGPVQAGVDVYY